MAKKVVSVILVLAMILSISTTAFATPNQPQKGQIARESIEQMIVQQEGSSDVEIQVSSGAVAVFVLGILAGYVIDGIFIYTTGYSGGELADALIRKIENFVKYGTFRSAYVDKNGNLTGSSTSGKFSVELSYM